MNYYFNWDFNKAISNEKKHKITFERATSVFKDPNALTIFDLEHSNNDDRWITLGIDNRGILIVVIHNYTFKEKNSYIRIISARKATKNEFSKYLELNNEERI